MIDKQSKMTSGIPTELFVGYVEPEDISDDELEQMSERELTRLGIHRLEISTNNFTSEELVRLEALEAEGYSPSYIFNTGLEAIDRTHAHEIKQIFTLGLTKLEMDLRSR